GVPARGLEGLAAGVDVVGAASGLALRAPGGSGVAGLLRPRAALSLRVRRFRGASPRPGRGRHAGRGWRSDSRSQRGRHLPRSRVRDRSAGARGRDRSSSGVACRTGGGRPQAPPRSAPRLASYNPRVEGVELKLDLPRAVWLVPLGTAVAAVVTWTAWCDSPTAAWVGAAFIVLTGLLVFSLVLEGLPHERRWGNRLGRTAIAGGAGLVTSAITFRAAFLGPYLRCPFVYEGSLPPHPTRAA